MEAKWEPNLVINILPLHYLTNVKEKSIQKHVAIIILAAGSSSRLGQSKQLVEVAGKTLLQKTVLTALDACVENVVVVLGSQPTIHREVIDALPIEIVENEYWQHGMGNSLKTGLNHLLHKHPITSAVITLVCDQPFLTSDHVRKIINCYHNTQAEIVASKYTHIKGVPALFNENLFPALLSLSDEQGARKIIDSHKGSIETIDFPNGEIDLDTPEDLIKLQQSGN